LITRLKARLRDGQRTIRERFLAGGDAVRLLHERCQLVDEVLCELWSNLAMPASLALIAVGGYGRGELYPASDVDLLILLPEPADDVLTTRIEQLICVFWDVGLETGHSVRTLEQCLEEAAGDITVQTAMIEARLLIGSSRLFQGLTALIRSSLDAPAFFQSKRIQQEDRHQRFSDTPYSLEANCKEGPGGLRDLHVVLWTARAAGFGHHWRDLARRVATINQRDGMVRAAPLRDEIGGGRKVAIHILEFFDRIGYTRRVRDTHVLRGNPEQFGS